MKKIILLSAIMILFNIANAQDIGNVEQDGRAVNVFDTNGSRMRSDYLYENYVVKGFNDNIYIALSSTGGTQGFIYHKTGWNVVFSLPIGGTAIIYGNEVRVKNSDGSIYRIINENGK